MAQIINQSIDLTKAASALFRPFQDYYIYESITVPCKELANIHFETLGILAKGRWEKLLDGGLRLKGPLHLRIPPSLAPKIVGALFINACLWMFVHKKKICLIKISRFSPNTQKAIKIAGFIFTTALTFYLLNTFLWQPKVQFFPKGTTFSQNPSFVNLLFNLPAPVDVKLPPLIES